MDSTFILIWKLLQFPPWRMQFYIFLMDREVREMDAASGRRHYAFWIIYFLVEAFWSILFLHKHIYPYQETWWTSPKVISTQSHIGNDPINCSLLLYIASLIFLILSLEDQCLGKWSKIGKESEFREIKTQKEVLLPHLEFTEGRLRSAQSSISVSQFAINKQHEVKIKL